MIPEACTCVFGLRARTAPSRGEVSCVRWIGLRHKHKCKQAYPITILAQGLNHPIQKPASPHPPHTTTHTIVRHYLISDLIKNLNDTESSRHFPRAWDPRTQEAACGLPTSFAVCLRAPANRLRGDRVCLNGSAATTCVVWLRGDRMCPRALRRPRVSGSVATACVSMAPRRPRVSEVGGQRSPRQAARGAALVPPFSPDGPEGIVSLADHHRARTFPCAVMVR